MRSSESSRAFTPALVLLVDDNRDGVLARRSVLEELGYTVVAAHSGADALALTEHHAFDLIITDYKMAPVDGLELIRNLREREVRVPIILLTGFADTLGLKPETTGADAVVQKSSNEIVTLVRNAKRLLAPPRKPMNKQRRATTRSRSQGTSS